MSILIKPTDTFTIKIIVGIESSVPKKYYCCLASDQQAASWPASVTTEEHAFTFREADFRSNSTIIDRSVELTDKGVRINAAALKLNRLISTLVAWTLLGDDGKPVPVSDEAVSSLPPICAMILNDELDKSQVGI